MARSETETSIYGRVVEATHLAGGYLGRLGPLLAEPEGNGPATGTIGRSAPESREPWAAQAASAYWDIWFGARSVLVMMRYGAGLRRARAEVAGPEALDAIRNYAPSASEYALKLAARNLDRWNRAAGHVPALDEGEPWAGLPQVPGRPPVACPYCRTYSLRMLVRKGEVRCFFPGCRDTDGSQPVARMEVGRRTGDGILIFGDGMTMGGAA